MRIANTCNGQVETGESDAVFILEDGAVLSNAIIGPKNGEGVHCRGSCTLNNVWWTDVCEDAATFKQKSGTSYVNGGGARKAEDKVFQHNGAGTVAVKNFWAETIGKLYRSCGNCATQYARKSTFDNIKVNGGKLVAGVNGNLGGKILRDIAIEQSLIIAIRYHNYQECLFAGYQDLRFVQRGDERRADQDCFWTRWQDLRYERHQDEWMLIVLETK